MDTISTEEIAKSVEDNIQLFHEKQLDKLKRLKLLNVLSRKNPYLFRAKHLIVATDLVKYLLDAFLVSQEETNFGVFLEELAIFICSRVYGGAKSKNTGMDLEFEKEGIFYIVSIKSGPNWGNSDQINRMKQNFQTLRERLVENGGRVNIIAVNGCCYGRDDNPDKGTYLKLCGQRFWTLISGIETLYTDIIEPLGHKAKEKNESFAEEYGKLINRFTHDFMTQFCDANGAILWDEVVKLSSAEQLPSFGGATKRLNRRTRKIHNTD